MVGEPEGATAASMLRGLVAPMEKHHKVRVTDEAIVAAVNLSNRYIPARKLPDKAVSLLDTACARVAVSQHAIPAEGEDSRRRIGSLEIESGIIQRRAAGGVDVCTRRDDGAEKGMQERRSQGRRGRQSCTRPADPLRPGIWGQGFIATSTERAIFADETSFAGIMPETGPPPHGSELK